MNETHAEETLRKLRAIWPETEQEFEAELEALDVDLQKLEDPEQEWLGPDVMIDPLVVYNGPHVAEAEPCSLCMGSGQIEDAECFNCMGSGLVYVLSSELPAVPLEDVPVASAVEQGITLRYYRPRDEWHVETPTNQMVFPTLAKAAEGIILYATRHA